MLPDFVCIGSQKAGTGWLNRNLKYHPKIWMPPIKELHYFTRPANFYILSLFGRNRFKRRSVFQDLKRGGHHLKSYPNDLGWMVRFFLFPRHDKWYASLFSPGSDQVCGEVTPAYETLAAEEIAHFHQLLPNTKIILMTRNPIERVWSNTAMNFRKMGYSDLSVVNEQVIEDYLLGNEFVFGRSDYMRTLNAWESFYPPEQIFVGYQDQMRNEPEVLLRTIHSFIGVETNEAYLPKDLKERKNVGSYPEIPPKLSRMLAERLMEPIEKFHERFQNRYTENWVAYTKQLL